MYYFYIRSHSFSIMQISETGSENPFYCTMYIILHVRHFFGHIHFIRIMASTYATGSSTTNSTKLLLGLFHASYILFEGGFEILRWEHLVFQCTKEGVASSWGCHALLFLESILFRELGMALPLVSVTAMVHSEYEQEYQKHIVFVNKSPIHCSFET